MKRPARISLRLLLTVAVIAALGGAAVIAVRAFSLPEVQVTRVTTGPVVQAFYATGTVVPEREYAVHANVAGILLLEPGIDKGVVVRKDQLLARIASDDLEKKLKQAEAELREKKARADEKDSPVLAEFDKRMEAFAEIMAIAQREERRLLTLSETGGAKMIEIERAQDRIATSRSELEAAKAQRAAKLLEVKKDLEMAQGNLEIAQWNARQAEILAPVDGVVLDWPVPNRTRLAINDHVLTLADVRPDKLVMRAAVDEEDKNKLRVGQLVEMTLYSFPNDKDKFTGHVKTIYHKADPQRRTFEVDVAIDRPATQPAAGPNLYDQFSPGMTGELAFIEQAKQEAKILPRQSLQGDAFYLVRNGKLERVAAQAGVKNVTRVEVLGGVEPDALVLLSPIGKMKPGDSVRTQFVDPRAAADLNKPPDTEIFKGGF
jgi:RND family efflux transporter MFP subunit